MISLLIRNLYLEQVDTISLDEASKLLLGEGREETNMRSKYFHFRFLTMEL
jgi:hypothetical protein